MDIGIIGGGINGLCCAWQLARQGHRVQLYERDQLMSATSRSSSKLLHGGLRYLENREFRLVREALRERDAWIKRAPHLAKPLRLVMPIYQHSRRPGWMVGMGLFVYDHLGGKSILPKATRLTAQELIHRDRSHHKRRSSHHHIRGLPQARPSHQYCRPVGATAHATKWDSNAIPA